MLIVEEWGCGLTQFTCNNGTCIDGSRAHDGEADCIGGEDEIEGGYCNVLRCKL